jgi:hypothetical protein
MAEKLQARGAAWQKLTNGESKKTKGRHPAAP